MDAGQMASLEVDLQCFQQKKNPDLAGEGWNLN